MWPWAGRRMSCPPGPRVLFPLFLRTIGEKKKCNLQITPSPLPLCRPNIKSSARRRMSKRNRSEDYVLQTTTILNKTVYLEKKNTSKRMM